MGFAASFKDLETYKLAREISFEIFNFSKSFPPEEKYSLTDQIRRSSRSVGAQIAECWGERAYEKHFILKLSDADAENYETEHWLEIAKECGYLPNDQYDKMNGKCETLGKMINNMIHKSKQFCMIKS